MTYCWPTMMAINLVMVLLDLCVAFDTIEHKILLDCLET